MNKNYEEIKTCRCCGEKVIEYLNLNKQPLANNYHDNIEPLEEYPLALNLCPKCYHSQLSIVVNPDIMFKNYLYVSGTAKTLQDYFKWFCDFTLQNKNKKNLSVLDIACNDGSQLSHYQLKGCKVWGVDPAQNLANLALEKNIELINDYWSEKAALSILDKNKGVLDIIIAQNVFAHTNDILNFLKACKILMNEKTDLYIQTSQANMFDENQFDTAYHEHLSFFNTNSMKVVVEKAGLFLNKVYIAPIHGNSYIFKINLLEDKDSNVQEMIINEKNRNLYSIKKYEDFKNNAINIRNDLKQGLVELKNKGYKIIGYGAAAKGMTVLNFANIKYPLIDYIIDDNELKHNKFTPGSNIPITTITTLKNEINKLAIIPLAWNFFEEIKNKIKNQKLDNNIVYIKYFPHYELHS